MRKLLEKIFENNAFSRSIIFKIDKVFSFQRIKTNTFLMESADQSFFRLATKWKGNNTKNQPNENSSSKN